MKNQEWVVCVGCGPSQVPLIRAAKAYGYSVIGIDRSPSCDLADIIIPISTYFKSDVLDELNTSGKYPKFKAVLSRTSGPAVETAFVIADHYSLKSPGRLVVNCSLSKWNLFKWAKQNSVPTIATLRSMTLDSIPKDWGELVIKPAVPIYGKKNVFLVKQYDQIKLAIQKACNESLDNYSIVQPFVLGKDIGFVTLCRQGKILWSSFYQENNSFNNGTVSAVGVSSLKEDFPPKVEKRIHASAELLLKESNADGFVFFSFRCDNSGNSFLYEVNPGLCGDALADKLLPAMWPGVNFFEIDVAAMTGLPLLLPDVSQSDYR